jgi:ATP-dependent RNA helicase DeaD
MHQPQKLDFSPTNLSVETIQQYYFTVDQGRKYELLIRLLQREEPTQAIVFCRTKRGTERLYQRLTKRFQEVGCIHGDMQQSARDRVMQRFRKGTLKILIATDVVGRGIDVTAISHIINYDIPQFCDDYVHRVGRTGRMGREGIAFTFVTTEQGPELTRIEMRIDRQLERGEVAGFDAMEKPAAAEPTVALGSGTPEASSAEPEGHTAEKKTPSSLLGRRGRSPKRYRRAL